MISIENLRSKAFKAGLMAAGLLVAFVLGCVAGWKQKPAEVKVQDRIVTKEVIKEVVKEAEKKTEAKTVDSSLQKRVHRETVETRAPDGTTTKKTTEDIGVDRVVKDVEIRYVDREVVRTVEVEKKVDAATTTTTKASQPQWRLSPMVGLDVTKVNFQQGLAGLQAGRDLLTCGPGAAPLEAEPTRDPDAGRLRGGHRHPET